MPGRSAPIGFKADHFALDHHIGFELLPFEGKRLDHRQFDTILFHAAYPDVDRLAFTDNILDFINWIFAQLRNMDHTWNALPDIH
jgi:hypothetical protein